MDNDPELDIERHRTISSSTRPHTATTSLVVGWDHESASGSALTFAVDLARRLAAHLHVVHIVDIDDLPVDPDSPDWEDEIRHTLDSQAHEAVSALHDVDAGWTYHCAHGDPARLLISVAHENDSLMVVVGSPHRGLRSFLESLGTPSVAHGLIGRHDLPTLVVPRDTDEAHR
ncbi:universal stress protein [Williamsia herbipolensis]|uniref:universal stress protein n=1 Tax=Williamsia herbipolensis TaxID=1603258 RepID=UPI00069890AA|nr:universal stress protein [Williamsia herbipolensis]